jgi:lipopolysaccharide assembly protein A
MASTPDPRTRKASAVRLSPRQILLLVILVVTAVFIGQNRDRVTIDLFAINVTAPLWMILVIMVALGLLIGLLLRRRAR